MKKIYIQNIAQAVRDGLAINETNTNKIKSYDSVYKSLWNIRHENKPTLPNPHNDVILKNDLYTKTNDDELFLLFDINDIARRIIGFVSQTGIEMLSLSTQWHADGTFKAAPPDFMQIYFIYAWYKEHMNFCFAAVLTDKEENSYKLMLERLVSRSHLTLKPEIVFVDFERADINAFDFVFHCTIKGCNFHFTNSIRRNVQ